MKKIMFGTPLAKNTVHAEYARSIANGMTHLSARGYSCKYLTATHADVATNRNILCMEAIGAGADYLIFCDDDMSFDPDDLLAMIQADKECVASMYVGKVISSNLRITADNATIDLILAKSATAQFTPIGSEKETFTQRGQILEVARVGTGLMIIKVEMLRALIAKEAIRKYTTHSGKDIHNFFRFNYSGGEGSVGEDFCFCELIRANGYGVWLYVTDRTRHYGDYGHHFVF